MEASSRGSGWTSFDLDVLAEPEEGEERSQPNTQDTPAGITEDEERRLLASPEYRRMEIYMARCEIRLVLY